MASMMELLMGDGDEAPDAAVRALSKQQASNPCALQPSWSPPPLVD